MFQILFVLLAIFSKIIGSAAGALLTRFDMTRSLRIGIGMVPRGEVALIISTMAYHRNLIDVDILSTTIILVVVTSVLTPYLLRNSFTLTKRRHSV
jgi:Kef-type K+ transport system membrane component KefB